MPTSRTRCRAISAAAERTSGFVRRFIARRARPDMDVKLDRRDFVKLSSVASAGILLGIPLPARAHHPDAPSAHELAAWIQVGTDDTVTLWVSKSDMGQDVRTALPMIIAEEMDADFSKVRIR